MHPAPRGLTHNPATSRKAHHEEHHSPPSPPSRPSWPSAPAHPRPRMPGHRQRLPHLAVLTAHLLDGAIIATTIGNGIEQPGTRRSPSPPETRPSTATINDSQVAEDFQTTLPARCPGTGTPASNTSPSSRPDDRDRPVLHRRTGRRHRLLQPLDSITIIYAPTSSVPTLTKMGEITSDLDAFENLPHNVDMRIELQQ